MKLSEKEKVILSGNKGELLRKCLLSLVRYGEFYDADKFLSISSGHVAMSGGATVLETYLDILNNLANEGIRFSVPTTINPRYMTEEPTLIEKILLKRQEELESNFKKMGGIENYSCTPYFEDYGDNVPKRGDILAWAESNAVIYVNSVIGAKTNRTSVLMDLFSAVLGITPNFGLLIDDNRKADYEVILNLNEKTDFALIGYLIGEKLLDKIPLIRGLKNASNDDLKNVGAAMAASGGIGMYHVEGHTPEARDLKEDVLKKGHETIIINNKMINVLRKRLEMGRKKTRLIFIGCPHLSYDELVSITKLIEGRILKKKTWINSAPHVIREFKNSEYHSKLEKTGAQLVSICPYTMFNAPALRRKWILTNSGKMRHYSPAYYGDLKDCLKEALGGEINAI